MNRTRPAELATALADLRDSTRKAAVDTLWIAAMAVWSVSAVVGRFAPRTAQRLDRIATSIESLADRDAD